MDQMFDTTITEFPFVAELPKREKSKVALLWDRFARLKAISDEKGMLLPPVFCAKLLGVSKQRVYVLLEEGKMERVEIDGQVFVTEDSLVAWCKAEHKTGRPLTIRQSIEVGQAMVKGQT